MDNRRCALLYPKDTGRAPGLRRNRTTWYNTGVPAWDAAYEAVETLKDDRDRRTLLLRERTGSRRFVCKRASGEEAAVLRREYELLRALPGPARFETLELWDEGGVCSLLRDYIPGSTLAALVERDGVLRPPEAAELGVKICRAVGALHAMTPPVIHRDLKPENILLTETGRVRLIDLGAARSYKPGRDEDTVLLGTRGYAAPEQYGSGQTDARTDIFALGKVLAYALAGEYTDAPPRLNGRDRALERIIRRCCAYDPARRYPDTERLEKALDRYLARRAIPTRSLVLVACAGLLLCGGALWGGYELGLRAPAPVPEVREVSGWDPFRLESNVADILRLAGGGDWPGLAAACEELVTALEADPVIRSVEPVAYRDLDEAARADYDVSRRGFEFMADRLAYGDGLAVGRLGTYEAAMPAFASALMNRVDYVWTEQSGQTRSSALHELAVDGNDQNIDGCVIEILEELNRALEQTAAP